MDLTTQNIQDLNTAWRTNFQNGRAAVEPLWMRIATEVPSTTSSNTYGWLGEWPNIREWVGDRQHKAIAAHDYSVKNKKFESTVDVPADTIDDDNYGVYAPLMTELGRAVGVFPDQLVFQALKDGYATKCYDGQNFFDNDHPVEVNGVEASVSNMTAGAAQPWFLLDTSRTLKPMIYQKRRDFDFVAKNSPQDSDRVFETDLFSYGTKGRANVGYGFWQMAHASKADLTKASFRAARHAMRDLKSDEGRPLGIRPNIILVGTSNVDKAKDLFMPERDENGSTNTERNAVEIVEVDWLD